MSDSSPRQPVFDQPTGDEVEYRAFSGLAVAGLILGLLSPLALVNVWLTLLPLVGAAVSALALVQIAQRGGELTGRRTATVGLILSLALTAAGPTDHFVGRLLIRREAAAFADLWFDTLRRGDPLANHHLSLAPKYRRALDDGLPEFYRQAPGWQDGLKTYLQQPVIRALLALGPKAEVRFYETEGQDQLDGRDWVRLIYAVTYQDEGRRKSFFVGLVLERTVAEAGKANWRFVSVEGGVRPASWPVSLSPRE